MLEQLVRPFQSPSVTATRRIVVSARTIEEQEAGLSWGSAGALPEGVEEDDPQEDTGYNFRTVCCRDQLAEDSRETEDVRVENPDDPSQYVIVRRIRKINFKKKSQCSATGYQMWTDYMQEVMDEIFDVGEDEQCAQVFDLHSGA